MAFRLEVSDMALFAQDYAFRIGGVSNRNMNGFPEYIKCKCPKCSKNIAAVYVGNRGTNWIVACPNDKCNYSQSLYKSIFFSSDEDLKSRWTQLYNQKRDENYKWWYERKYGWKPIKSRKCKTHLKIDMQDILSSMDNTE